LLRSFNDDFAVEESTDGWSSATMMEASSATATAKNAIKKI
jgi:hypothetical protein